MRVSKLIKIGFLLVVFLSLIVNVSFANEITIVPASPLTGPILKNTYSDHRGDYAPFDTTQDLAFQGNGFAQPAVAKNVHGLYPEIHQPEFANDGYYGIGASWVAGSEDSWLKINLGRNVTIDRVNIGRSRLNDGINSRDPGPFTIAVALSDNVYANGNDSNDQNEYVQVFDAATVGFSGFISGDDTLQASFTPVLARFIKLQVYPWGAPPPSVEPLFDEVEVFGGNSESTDKIFLKSGGSLNDTSINISEPVITVETGDSISGTIKIQVENGHGSNAVVPVIYTPTWGSHSTSYETVDSWADTGTSNYDATINLTAPDESGTYYIIFASAGQTNGSYIASFTQWTVGTPSWNDGNDLADYTESDMGNCLSTGSAAVSDLLSDGSHVQTTYGMTYIKINVINTSPTTTTTTGSTTTIPPEDNTGELGGPCYGNGTCNEGLTCVGTICMNIPCIASAVLGIDDPRLETLRSFRDEVLIQTPVGKEIIRLYYKWSPLVVKAMEEDEEFKEEVREMIDEILPLIE